MNQGRYEGERRGSWEDRDSRRDEAFEDEWARPQGRSQARGSSYGGTRPDQGHGGWPDEGGYLGRDERHQRGRNQDMDEGLSARDSGGRYDGGTQGSRGQRGDWREGQGRRGAQSGESAEYGYGEGRYGEDYGEQRYTSHGNQGYSAGGRGWGGDVGEGIRGRGDQGMQRGGRGMEGQRHGQGQGYGQGYGQGQREGQSYGQGRGYDYGQEQGGGQGQRFGRGMGQQPGQQRGRQWGQQEGQQGGQQWGQDEGIRQRMGQDTDYGGGGSDEERRHRGGGPFPDQTRRPWRSVAEPDDPRTRELYAGAYGISDSETPSLQGWASEARWHDEGWRDQGGGLPLSERPGAGGRPGGWPADEGRRIGRHTHGQEYAYEGFTGAGTGAGMGGVQAGQTQRRVVPKGYQRSDQRIREDVCERLAHEPGLDVRQVEVNVKDGVVTLSGNVNDRRQKYRMEDIADDCFGVKDVDNQVRVQRYGQSSGSGSSSSSGGMTGGGEGDGRISGVSVSSAATGSTASSYGGGLEVGSGEREPKGGEPYGGTTNPTKSVT